MLTRANVWRIPHLVSRPVSFLTSFESDHHVILCWLVKCTTISVRFQQWNKNNLLHLNAADICCHLWTCAWLIVKVLFGISLFFAALLYFSLCGKHGGHSSFFVARNINRDVLIGWSYRVIGSLKSTTLSDSVYKSIARSNRLCTFSY